MLVGTVIEKPMTIEALRETVDAAIVLRRGRFQNDQAPSGELPPDQPSPRLRRSAEVLRATAEGGSPDFAMISSAAAAMRPRSAAERWAVHVLKACDAEGDLRTMESWATRSGVSVSSLAESCNLLGIQPRDARDFTRLLRALIKSTQHDCDPRALLDVSDPRTLGTLLDRGGLADAGKDRLSVEQFLDRQRFVSAGNNGVRVLRALLTGRS
jgi:hypothetical protein